MADYGAYYPPTDIELQEAHKRRDVAQREVWFWERIIKRLEKKDHNE